MNLSADSLLFVKRLETFKPDNNGLTRSICLYAASITLADAEIMKQAITLTRKYQVTRESCYEIVLQSYLFLGFPRMLTAGETFQEMYPAEGKADIECAKISSEEADRWFDDGLNLYRRVYDNKHEILRKKVMSFAPEIFRWMVIEGYGKVLSREALDIKIRELAIIAFLTMENRPQQLYSHIQGAVNVGTSPELIMAVINDIGSAAGDGYSTGIDICKRLGLA